jgi:hypothetical protein
MGTTTAMAIFALLLRPAEPPSVPPSGVAVVVVVEPVVPGRVTVGVRVTTMTSVLVLSVGEGTSVVGVVWGGVVGVVGVGEGVVGVVGSVVGGGGVGVDVEDGGGSDVDGVVVPGSSAPAVGLEASLGDRLVPDVDIVLFWNLEKVANLLPAKTMLATVHQQRMP